MGDIVGTILWALGVVLPVIAYLWASRDARRTRVQVLMAATLGGGVAAMLTAIVAGISARSLGFALEMWPWAAVTTMQGCAIGVLGLLARSFGAWLSRRP
jgi:hypothetical protein